MCEAGLPHEESGDEIQQVRGCRCRNVLVSFDTDDVRNCLTGKLLVYLFFHASIQSSKHQTKNRHLAIASLSLLKAAV